mgnify:CR=1 FL=1
MYADSLKIHKIDTKSGDPIQILALPWIRKSHLIAQGKNLDGKPPDEINRMIQERISNAVKEMARELDPKIPAICSAHITIKESVTSSEVSMMLGDDHGLFTNQLALPNFDYIALGHIHKHQKLGNSPPIVYSGSLQRVDFSEENDVKGFCLVEIDPQQKPGERAQWSFIPVDARTFLTIRIVIPNQDEDPTQTVLDEIQRHHTEGSVIRLHITLPNDLVSKLDERKIRTSLTGAFFVTPFIKEWAKKNKTTRLATSNSITPNEALKIYLETHGGIDRAEKNKALKLGKEMIEQQLEN